MGLRCRHHVNPLGLAFQRLEVSARPKLADGRPVEVEIGCADAEFLFARARLDPSRTYVGLEIREPLVEQVNRQAREADLPVQAIFCHANRHLGDLLPLSSVERVYLNFPDPWFKRRHRKRRMVDEDLVEGIEHVLSPGGDLFFQSDVWDLALEAMDLFERRDRFVNLAGAWSFWKRPNPYGARSARERVCEEEERKIWRIRYRNGRAYSGSSSPGCSARQRASSSS